jgi:hypothetical protein
VSSILEALRELEGERPPASRRDIPPPEPPRKARKALGAFIPIIGGLAVGMVVFGLWAWGPNLAPTMAPPSSSSSPAPVAGATASADAPAADRPTWLDKAEPPRARVTRGATPPPASEPERSAAVERAAPPPPPARRPTTADDEGTPGPAADEPPPARGSGGQVAVESVAYAADAGARVATIRYHGRRVTLRQRETIGDIEVQLIMPNGVYVQRAGEVFLLPVSR